MQQGTFTFQSERCQDIRNELFPLLEESWKEVSSHYPRSNLLPNYDFYFGLEDAGALVLNTARVDGVLTGYLLATLINHPHRSGDLVAYVDTFFVLPDYRKMGVASRLIRFAEDQLRGIGAFSLSVVARDKKQRRLFSMFGYHKQEVICEKEL